MATAEGRVADAWAPPASRTVLAIRIVEIVVGTLTFLVLLQWILRFDLLERRLWLDPDVGYLGAFLRGIRGTVGYVALIVPLSLVFGFLFGWARVSRLKTLRWPVAVYVDFFRGVPPLVVVIFAFLFGPVLFPGRLRDVGLTLAAIALAAHSAAYQAEIFRAGFQSVPRGQLEASQALGMRSAQSMRFVILPQALRLSLPPLGNELAVLIKDTSLLAVVGALELFAITQEFAAIVVFVPGAKLVWYFTMWTAVALAYFAMTFAVTRGLSLLESKYHVSGLEAVSV